MDSRKQSFKKDIKYFVVKKKMYRKADFSAKKLAEMLGVPDYKLSRIMKAEFGMSYADLVLTNRVEEAKKLLCNSRYASFSVDYIGMLVGFKNRMSYYEAFHRYANTTPRKFRDKCGCGDDSQKEG